MSCNFLNQLEHASERILHLLGSIFSSRYTLGAAVNIYSSRTRYERSTKTTMLMFIIVKEHVTQGNSVAHQCVLIVSGQQWIGLRGTEDTAHRQYFGLLVFGSSMVFDDNENTLNSI